MALTSGVSKGDKIMWVMHLSYGERIKRARTQKGFSQQKLAEMMNVARSTISMWENETNIPDAVMLTRLAEILEVSADYLLGLVDNPIARLRGEVRLKSGKEQVVIPILGRVSAGKGVPAEDDVIGETLVDSDEYVHFALVVEGHSMHPRLMNGDVVYVRKQPLARNGQMAIVRINGSDGVIKYFFKRDDGVVLKSENPESKPQFIPAMKWDQECAVIGVVVSYKRNMPDFEN